MKNAKGTSIADARRTFSYVSGRVDVPDKVIRQSAPSRNQRFCDGDPFDNLFTSIKPRYLDEVQGKGILSRGAYLIVRNPQFCPTENTFGGDPEVYPTQNPADFTRGPRRICFYVN